MKKPLIAAAFPHSHAADKRSFDTWQLSIHQKMEDFEDCKKLICSNYHDNNITKKIVMMSTSRGGDSHVIHGNFSLRTAAHQ